MQNHETRLIQYDYTPKEARPTLLKTFFDEAELRRTFRQIAEDRVTRAIREFVNLDVIPLEDYQLLEKRGYIESRNSFRTYVPTARGLEFPDVRLTCKGQNFKVKGVYDQFTDDLFDSLILAYRARSTGHGVVAGRETLEEWLEEGDEMKLAMLVDPLTGDPLDAFDEENVLFEICDPAYREEMVQKRAGKIVAEPLTQSKLCHDVSPP